MNWYRISRPKSPDIIFETSFVKKYVNPVLQSTLVVCRVVFIYYISIYLLLWVTQGYMNGPMLVVIPDGLYDSIKHNGFISELFLENTKPFVCPSNRLETTRFI